MVEQAADDGRIKLSSLFMASVTVWQRLLCRSLSLSFINQVTCRLQEFFVCHTEAADRHSLGVDINRCLFSITDSGNGCRCENPQLTALIFLTCKLLAFLKAFTFIK